MASGSQNMTTYKAKQLVNTYGSDTKPVYINAGVPTILGTIGGQYDPVWVNSGVVTAITAGTTGQFYRGDKTWSNELTGDISIGSRGVTSGPSSITYSNRITIVPYFHTGGPWYIKSGDDSSNAYLALYYSTTQLMRIKHDGTQMIDWKGNASTATALTSDAGGTEQPIYFTGGKPSATSYALKATVNNGDANYVAYYSGARAISSSKAATGMIMPAHYYHNLYNDNPTTGTTVYVHYFNSATTSTNSFANLRVKSGSSYKVLAFGGDGALTWEGTMTASGTIHANGGYLKSTLNGNTVTIGSGNTSWCHFSNSANIPFYFDKAVHVNGDVYYYNTKVHMSSSGFHPPKNGGIYWDPYVESASDASDVTSIYQIASGVAGGTELRINQQNDAADCINLCTNSYIYLNSKRAFTISDSWLRINEDKGFSSGIYTGSSLIRTDNQLQVGDGGAKFYANSSGNGYFSNTLGIAGTNTGYNLYVNGTAKHTGRLYQTNWIEFTDSSGLYLPSSGSGTHFYPANDVTYGSFQMIGTKGGYRGITMGTSNNDLTIMSNGNDEGLYNATKGRWIIYYNRTNDQIGIFGSSTASGYNVRINGSLYVNSTLYVPGDHIYTDKNVYCHNLWANRSDGEKQVGVDNGTAGNLYLWSNSSEKGIYSSSGYQTGYVIRITSGERRFYGVSTSADSTYVTGSSGTLYLTGVPEYATKNQTHYIYSPNYINGGNYYGYGLLMPTTVGSYSASQPMAICYGRVQCYGTLCINADTDGSQTEYAIITSGRGVSGSTSDGLWVGYSSAGLFGQISYSTNQWLEGNAGHIYFGGNFHIDSKGSNHLYLNYHNPSYNIYFGSQGYAIYNNGANYNGTSAACSGNAASATQLQTSRSIWGQSFNGTGNISGSLTANEAITLSRSAYSDSGCQIKISSNRTFGMLLGSGGVNRGLYDFTNNHWFLYYDDNNTSMQAKGGWRVAIQTDGNLVVYNGNTAYWSARYGKHRSDY